MAKLTLHVDDRLIAVAKSEAASRKTSLSRLVSDYFRAFSPRNSQVEERQLPPVTASLVGCLPGSDGSAVDEDAAYLVFLEKKHL